MNNTTTLNARIFTFFLLLSFIAGCSMSTEPQARVKQPLTSWQFCQDTSPEGSQLAIPENGQWTPLEIPHAFRLSGLNEKSAGWYRTTIPATQADSNKQFWLLLEGAGSVADVFVNNQHIGQHKGAYTAAAFDLSLAMRYDQDNTLLIRVTNRDTEAANCLSQSNLFYTSGGLYRPVWLIKTGQIHIFPDMGSTGVYLTPKNIDADHGDLEINTYLHNSSPDNSNIQLRHTIFGPQKDLITTTQTQVDISAGETKNVVLTAAIANLKLWDIQKPNLYSVLTEILVDGKVTDSLTEHTGFRTVQMQDGHFMVNGQKLLARGVCKHHQSEQHWNAMTDSELLAEWNSMLELGCNTIRLAHYPHRRFEYSIADENGIAIWAENGLAGQKWDGAVKRETKPTPDGERITREMVRQNWNHPSIIFWSSGNETYQEVASHYADIIRSEDTTRLITYASAGEVPSNVDFVAGNTYQGWYYEHYTNFKQLPRNAFVSETGSGSWVTHHVPYGTVKWTVDKFEPEEYNELVAEYRFQTVFKNNPDGHKMFLWWNFREFYDRKFKGNRNTKGILTLAGMPKDFYYLFQAFMNPDQQVLHLCGRHHFYRQFEPDNGIKVYSNAETVELFINGVSQGTISNGEYSHPDYTERNGNQQQTVKGPKIDNVFFWKKPLADGKNVIEARDNRGNKQTMTIYQKPANGIMPIPADSLVTNLTSSNANSPAIFIDRAIEAQGPFYFETDGNSDNTFDIIPELLADSRWIATKRLSDPKNTTDISFTVTKPSFVCIMYSDGNFPAHTLNQPDNNIIQAAKAFTEELATNGFTDTTPSIQTTWRRHDLWLANAGVMARSLKTNESITIKGANLDYVILIKPIVFLQ